MSRRVVLVTADFPERSETFVVDKFLALLDQGFDVHVLTSRRGSIEPFPELARVQQGRVHAVEPWSLARLALGACAHPVRAVRALASVPREHLSETARDMVHALRLVALEPELVHAEFAWLARRLMQPAHSIGSATLVSFRGADANYVGLDDAEFYDDIWRGADAVHCLGEDLWRRVQDRGCPPDKRHVFISPAVDAERFCPRPRAHHGGPIRLVSVGRLHWKKGHEYAVEAMNIVRRAGVSAELHIVGEGGFREAIEAAIGEMGLHDHVSLTGAASRTEVRDAMQWADVFVHAAVSEGFANAVLEAQAMELPVVTTDADGLTANVSHGETGFVVPRRDPSAMAERIIELAHAPELRSRFGRAGRQRVQVGFRPSDQIDAFVRLYDELMAS